MVVLSLTDIDQQISNLLLKEDDDFSTDELSSLIELRMKTIVNLNKKFGKEWTKEQWQPIVERTRILADKMLQRQHKIGKDIQLYQYGRRKIDIYNKNR